MQYCACADPEGGQGVRTLNENIKAIGCFSNTGPGPLENHIATKPAFNAGPSPARQCNAIFGPVMVLLLEVFGSSFSL